VGAGGLLGEVGVVGDDGLDDARLLFDRDRA